MFFDYFQEEYICSIIAHLYICCVYNSIFLILSLEQYPKCTWPKFSRLEIIKSEITLFNLFFFLKKKTYHHFISSIIEMAFMSTCLLSFVLYLQRVKHMTWNHTWGPNNPSCVSFPLGTVPDYNLSIISLSLS